MTQSSRAAREIQSLTEDLLHLTPGTDFHSPPLPKPLSIESAWDKFTKNNELIGKILNEAKAQNICRFKDIESSPCTGLNISNDFLPSCRSIEDHRNLRLGMVSPFREDEDPQKERRSPLKLSINFE